MSPHCPGCAGPPHGSLTSSLSCCRADQAALWGLLLPRRLSLAREALLGQGHPMTSPSSVQLLLSLQTLAEHLPCASLEGYRTPRPRRPDLLLPRHTGPRLARYPQVTSGGYAPSLACRCR